jgi:hypothetical protein
LSNLIAGQGALLAVVSLAGCRAVGARALAVFAVRVPEPFDSPAEAVVGVALFSLLVELAAIAGAASVPVVVLLWAPIGLLGAAGLARIVARGVALPRTSDSSDMMVVVIIAVAVAALVVVSLAPSSKIDETFYHMLVPKRILEDGGLRFYREPWEAAILPQMLYQVGLTVFHAMGVPDAGNVLSAALSLTLLRFAWRFVLVESGSRARAAACTAALAVGLYPLVWHSASGGQAFGDLSLVLAVALLFRSARLSIDGDRLDGLIAISWLCACAAASKISVWPLASGVTVYAAWRLTRGILADRRVVFALLAAVAGWAMLLGPALLWTWARSGSPLGPMLAGSFGASSYSPGETMEIFAAVRSDNQWQASALVELATGYSPLVWISAVALLYARSVRLELRRALALLAIGQAMLVLIFLPHSARFLGGMPAALSILWWAVPTPLFPFTASTIAWKWAVRVLLVPWFGLQLFYASQFVPAVIGAESRRQFLHRYVALSDDLAALDRLLPPQAALLVDGEDRRIPSVYAPRPVYFDLRDVPASATPFLLTVGADSTVAPALTTRKERLVYSDPEAILEAYRTPWRQYRRGPLKVFSLTRP